jgi:probable HAF family extracellular repeat protein
MLPRTHLPLPTALALGGALLTLTACDDGTRSTAPTDRRMALAAERDTTAATPGAPFAVTIRDLGTLGGRVSQASGINKNGLVVGWGLNAAGQKRAFKWTVAEGMRTLAPLSSGPCAAHRANSLGQVVGWCQNAAGKAHAVLWSPSGVIRDLGTLPGQNTSEANDINDAGEVVGRSWSSSDEWFTQHGFRWTAAGGMRRLEENCNYDFSRAHGINRSGQAVGGMGDCQGGSQMQSIFWAASGNIQKYGGWRLGEITIAEAVNNAGDAAGSGYGDVYCGGDWDRSAVVWTASGHPETLAQLSGVCGQNRASEAHGINNAGLIVGEREAHSGRGDWRAFVWTRAGGFQDLVALPGGTQSQANGINDAKQVAGWSTTQSGARHAALWTLR